MQLQLVLWAAALMLLLQVSHIEGEGGHYTRCLSKSNIVQTMILLSDPKTLSCPSLFQSGKQKHCCFDRWVKEGTFFCCDTFTYLLLEVGILYILPAILVTIFVALATWICRCVPQLLRCCGD